MSKITQDAMQRTIAKQSQEIVELKTRIAELLSKLEEQHELTLAGELAQLIFDHPDNLENVLISSTSFH